MATERSESYFSIGILLIAAVLVGLVFLPELNAIVLGISVAILFQPWYAAIKKGLNDQSGIAAALIVLLAVAIILVPLIFFGLQMFAEAQGLYGQIASGGGMTAPVIEWSRAALHNWLPSLSIDLTPYIQQVLGLLIGNIGPIFSGVLNIVATIFLSFFALYYFLKDGSRLRSALVERGPLPAEHAEKILARLYARAGSVIRGSLLVALLYGVLTGVGFFIFGLPSAILWGAVTAVASFIPAIGVFLIVIPGIVSLYLGGNVVGAVGLVAWVFVMSTTIEMYLRPRLLGGKEKIHPMLMLFAVLGGLSFFGPIGILLGPLALSLLLTLLENYPLFDLESLNKK
jgi:predicted PurR-regulated permease PerM